MVDMVFDTLGLARRLRDRAGFSAEHAEEFAQAIAESVLGQVASKTDLALLRTEIKTDLAEMKSELTRLILTVATGQVALLLAAMFALARLSH